MKFLYPLPLEKGHTNFGHKGLNAKYSCIHILDQEAKTKFFCQCPSVRPSAKFVSKVYQISQYFARRFTKLKANAIFNDFSISWDPINEIDPYFFYFKDMD